MTPRNQRQKTIIRQVSLLARDPLLFIRQRIPLAKPHFDLLSALRRDRNRKIPPKDPTCLSFRQYWRGMKDHPQFEKAGLSRAQRRVQVRAWYPQFKEWAREHPKELAQIFAEIRRRRQISGARRRKLHATAQS